MTQNELNRAVANVTGESVRTIAHLGFGIADPEQVDFDLEPYGCDPESKALDWDALDAQRAVLVP